MHSDPGSGRTAVPDDFVSEVNRQDSDGPL